jgi:hypothetical protein
MAHFFFFWGGGGARGGATLWVGRPFLVMVVFFFFFFWVWPVGIGFFFLARAKNLTTYKLNNLDWIWIFCFFLTDLWWW